MLPANTKILIADDFLSMKKVLAKQLKQFGLTNISEASDGNEAWDKILDAHVNEVPFQIIFLDMHMPGKTGLEILKMCRSDKIFSNVPIIMVSAEDNKDVIREILKAGATDYIIKPPVEEVLEKKLIALESKIK